MKITDKLEQELDRYYNEFNEHIGLMNIRPDTSNKDIYKKINKAIREGRTIPVSDPIYQMGRGDTLVR